MNEHEWIKEFPAAITGCLHSGSGVILGQ